MTSNSKPECVTIGCWVKIDDPGLGEETLHIVEESKESPENGLFSTNNPFVQSMLGATQGESVTYTTPDGTSEKITVLDFGWDF